MALKLIILALLAIVVQALHTTPTKETPFRCRPGLIKCHKDCCHRHIQFCNEEEMRCTKCETVAHLCGTNDEKVGCGIVCQKYLLTTPSTPKTTSENASVSKTTTPQSDEDDHAVPSNVFILTTASLGTSLGICVVVIVVLAAGLITLLKRKMKDKHERMHHRECGNAADQPSNGHVKLCLRDHSLHDGGRHEETPLLVSAETGFRRGFTPPSVTNEDNTIQNGLANASAKADGQPHPKRLPEDQDRQAQQSPAFVGASICSGGSGSLDRRSGDNEQDRSGGKQTLGPLVHSSHFNGTGPGTAGMGGNRSIQAAEVTVGYQGQNGNVSSASQPAASPAGNQGQNSNMHLTSQPAGATHGNQGQNETSVPLNSQGALQFNGPLFNNPAPSTVKPEGHSANHQRNHSSSSQDSGAFQPAPPEGMAVEVRKDNDSMMPPPFRALNPSNDGNSQAKDITVVPSGMRIV